MQGKSFFRIQTIVPLVLLVSLLVPCSLASAAPFDEGWQYRKEITIDYTQVADNHTDFPVLISTNSDADLISHAQGDGTDIIFTGADGATKLKYEIESYSAGTLVAWVKVPSLSTTTDTIVYMYYGNFTPPPNPDPEGVWDLNYVMVQHLEEIDPLAHNDSTSEGNDSNVVVVTDQDATGNIDGADAFNGSTDYVRVPDDASLQFGEGSLTAEAWINPISATGSVRIVNNRGTGVGGSYKGWQLKITDAGGGNWRFTDTGIDDATGNPNYNPYDNLITSYPYGFWYHVVMVYEADTALRLYVNGVLDGEISPTRSYGDINNSNPTVIGASIVHEGTEGADNKQFFDGRIDEVRLSKEVRSAEWIDTTYNNQKPLSTFYTVGTECIADDVTCDGIDDDCDGTADEDYVSTPTACGTGACAETGATSCVAGSVEDSCTPGTPALDDATCDAIDDDCDGTDDEDYVSTPTACGTGACAETGATSCVAGSEEDSCTPGTPALDDATCDAIDDDCDGTDDEDYVSTPTACGTGACAETGATSCVAGSEEDSCTPGTPAADDTTCDAVDDDCDGTDDEDYVSTPTACGTGACAETGATSCVAGSVEDSCTPGTPAADDTTCDAIDDDCDGTDDEDYVSTLTSCGTGACAATGAIFCVAGSEEDSCTPGTPSAEICDDGVIDNDCDGLTDCVDPDCDGLDCNDSLFCNGTDTCSGGACSQHAGDPCTFPKVCNEGIDQCEGTEPGAWWDSAWPYRKQLTIDPATVNTDLTGFPVLVDLTDTDLASDAQPNGGDIVFTNYTGDKLAHEIESYDTGTGTLIAWVRVPTVSSTEGTILYIYFGNDLASDQQNPAGTWDSNYVMVQHLDETSGDHEDSTGYLNNSDLVVGTDQNAAGRIDGADDFAGTLTTGDYIRVPDNIDTSLQFGEGSFTAEAWINPRSVPDTTGARIVNNRGTGVGGTVAGWHLKIKNETGNWRFSDCGIDDATNNYMPYEGTTPYAYNDWYHVVMVYEADAELRFYVNGASDGPALTVGDYGSITNDHPTVIGASIVDGGIPGADNKQFFDGIIDEVRLSDIDRDADWISASYSNQNDPGGFYSVGDLESSTGPPTVSAPEPADGAIDVSTTLTALGFTINDPDEDLMDFTVTTNPDIGSATVIGVTDGTYNVAVSGMDAHTTYQWDISVTDGSGITDKSYTFTTEMIPGVWWNSTWTYRRVILLDSTDVAEDLNSFPVLIAIDDGSLLSNVQDDADDIAFTDYEGEQLNHEVESYDPLTGALVAWVSVPFLSSTEDTALYMYYGNSEATNQESGPAVWDSSYVMVQHLDETRGTHYDSTSNANDGTPVDVFLQNAMGKIDGADEFDDPESPAEIDVGTDTTLDVFGPAQDFSIFLWAKRDATTEVEGFFASGSNGDNGIFFGTSHMNEDDLKFMSLSNTVSLESTSEAVGDTGWHHVGVTADRDGNLTFWVDGVSVHSESIAGTSAEDWNRADDTYKIGTDRSENAPMDGMIDEVRVSDMVMSAGWIQTSYTNQNNPGAFYLLGSLEIVADADEDGVLDDLDNCPNYPNGPLQGTCTEVVGTNLIVSTGQFCTADADCAPDGFCEKTQADTYPPGGDGIGDACDCEGDFDCDAGGSDVDANNVEQFLWDFGRSVYQDPCTALRPCYGDFNCDGNVDADDIPKLLEDFGRTIFLNPCPACVRMPAEAWCVYP